MVWPDCQAVNVKGYHTQPHLKGLINMYMYIKLKVDTTHGCLYIEAYVKILTE